MIRISSKHSMEYKNDYFITQEIAVTSADSKTPGEEYTCKPQTYPNLLCAWSALKEKGEDGVKIMAVGEQLLNQHQSDVYQSYLKSKEAKQKSPEHNAGGEGE